MKDLKKRTITAIVLLAVLLPIAFFGSIPLYIVFGMLSIGAAWELERLFKQEEKWGIVNIVLISINGLMYTGLLVFLIFKLYLWILILLAIGLAIMSVIKIIKRDLKCSNLLLTIFYPSIGFASFSYLRSLETGLYRGGLLVVVYLFLVCVSTDTAAYFIGSKFGKHKLAPKISPNKTIEGSLAGTIAALIIPTLFVFLTGTNKYLFGTEFKLWYQILLCAILSISLSILDETGDLFASSIKRRYNAKDYSQIFPGHGGILDRFDSYLFVSFFLTIYVTIISVCAAL